ncbi:MAG TPA: hypothetical protein VMT38_01625 [Terracidiphilus sp.]|nr:hypothetical protein [Terracidiphilus sp.]
MQTAHAIHGAWHPQTKEEREAILSELEAILASPHFCNSKRYPALLRFIVENALANKADLLKERTLGIEVFDRPADYDTNADTVVRYTAGEVRKRLLLYYSEQDRPSAIRISLPAGSYVPEFSQVADENRAERAPGLPAEPNSGHRADNELHGGGETLSQTGNGKLSGRESQVFANPAAIKRLWIALVLTVVLLSALATGVRWKYGASHPQDQVQAFWAPVIRGQQSLTVVTGGSIFASDHYSGVETADKSIDYPFVSMQSVSAAVQISSMLARAGVATQLASAPSTELTDLREHSLTLLGAYNNRWTLRLQQSLRYYFVPGTNEIIVDRLHPEVQWKRDESLPYSSADDYAIAARFHDPTIDGWVVVLAGVGRNGTEAAAQFVTSQHYMQLLRDRLGSDIANKNVEVVLKINVIEGKTGAPAIVAVSTW